MSMLITIDQLLSYEPVFLQGKKYWKQGERLYMARINRFGLVEMTEMTPEPGEAKSA